MDVSNNLLSVLVTPKQHPQSWETDGLTDEANVLSCCSSDSNSKRTHSAAEEEEWAKDHSASWAERCRNNRISVSNGTS